MMMMKIETTRIGLGNIKTEVKEKKSEKLPEEVIEIEIVMGRLTPLQVAPLTIESMNPLPRLLTRGKGNKS